MVEEFTSSISFDKRMYAEDIAGSIAHATMLAKCGIIASEEASIIIEGLTSILADIEAGNFSFDLVSTADNAGVGEPIRSNGMIVSGNNY